MVRLGSAGRELSERRSKAEVGSLPKSLVLLEMFEYECFWASFFALGIEAEEAAEEQDQENLEVGGGARCWVILRPPSTLRLEFLVE